LRRLAAVVMTVLLALLLLLSGGGHTLALQETYTFEGSGWGHGVGMCQYGARGMAAAGFDYHQILTHYYQGTQVSGWSCPPSIRVGLLEGQSVIYLVADSGSFTFYTSGGDIPGGVMAPGGTWTVAADEHGRFFIVRPDGTCVNGTSYGGIYDPLYVRGAADGDVLRLTQNGSRKVSHLSHYTPLELNIYGGSPPYAMRAILISWFETYLRGIAEVSGSWPQEAVKAQAVAARSYAVRSMGKHASSNYDICDETHCQYYQGYDKEKDAGWLQAVEATAGQVLTYGGQVAHCFYSASCGGHTDNNEDVWFGSPVPYLRGVPCPWCKDPGNNPFASWTVTYSRGEMEGRLNSRTSTTVGTLYGMDLSDRTASGRVRYAYFTGSAGTVRVTGELLRSYFSLRSSMVNAQQDDPWQDNFDEYILLANPGSEAASAQVKMYAATGNEKRVDVEVPPRSRRTVHVDGHLYNDEVSAEVTSDRGIVCERAMYFDYQGSIDGGSCEHGATAAAREWYLAEGYTAQSFDTWILVFNPGGETARVDVDLLREDGHMQKVEMEVGARSRSTLNVDGVEGFSSCSLSARVTSDRDIVVERAMYFDSSGRRGGHVSLGTTRLSREWLFAEGYTAGSFDTWLLVGNPGDAAAAVRFHLYIPGGGGGKTVDAVVAPHSRYTLHANAHLGGSEIAVRVESDLPVVAERAMYFDYGGKRGGSCTLGAPAAGPRWYLAEGYTGGDFDTWVLVGNPTDEAARVKFTFLTQAGFAREAFFDVAPRSRFTLHVDDYFPDDEVSVIVEEAGGKGIVVERAMYFDYKGRRGGHAAMGVPGTSTTWLFAEGYTGS
jgi:SpoIID/LytB domain protein